MKKRVLDEKTMRMLETWIPKLASGAFAQAYANALTVSGKVLVARKGLLVETHADGSERVIRQLTAPTQVAVGTRRVRKVTEPA